MKVKKPLTYDELLSFIVECILRDLELQEILRNKIQMNEDVYES